MSINTDCVANAQGNITVQYLPNDDLIGLPDLSPDRGSYQKTSPSKLFALLQTKSYVPIPGCVLEHVICTPNLSYPEKLFFLLANSLAIINFKQTQVRAVALPAGSWASMLNCSKSQVFALQKSLAHKGYFLISRDKNSYEQNKRNLIIPTLPDQIASALSLQVNRVGAQETYAGFNSVVHDQATKLISLDQTKLFIPFNYQLLKIICQHTTLSSLQKVIWLDLYAFSFRAFNNHRNPQESYNIINSYCALAQRYNCNKSSLSKAMTTLQQYDFITKNRIFLKHSASLEERKDKVLWYFSICLPDDYLIILEKSINRSTISIPEKLKEATYPEPDKQRRKNPYQLANTQDSISSIYSQSNFTNYYISFSYRNDDTDSMKSTKALPSSYHISFYDPRIANSSLYINKNFKANNNLNTVKESIINNKDIKSNFGRTAKVILNNFYKKLKKQNQPFNICTSLIRQKLRTLSKDKADKARKFAYSLHTKKLAKGYAATIGKHELAKQLIFHAATWVPDKLGKLSKDQQADVALVVAWKRVTNGSWEKPLEWAKAGIMQREYEWHYQKYHQYGVLSAELGVLEKETSKLLGCFVSLDCEIKQGADLTENEDRGRSIVSLMEDRIASGNKAECQNDTSSEGFERRA